LLLLLVPIVAADVTSSLNDSVKINDQVTTNLLAALKGGLQEKLGIGDAIGASLIAPVLSSNTEAVRIGDEVATALATTMRSSIGEAVAIADRATARLLTPIPQNLGETVDLGDRVATTLAVTLRSSPGEAVGLADRATARLLAPITQGLDETVGVGDQVAANLAAVLRSSLGEALGLADRVTTRLFAPIPQNLAETVSVGDQLVTRLLTPVRHSLAEISAVTDQVTVRLLTPIRQLLAETVSINDQLGTSLVAPFRQSLAESVSVTDRAATTLRAAIRPLETEAMTISDTASTLSVSGATSTQVTTDSSGNTIVTGAAASGGTLFQVTLPPGTTESQSVSVTYTTSGSNSMVHVTGLSPPYPPGKTVTMLNAAGVTSICIVDSPTGANLQTAVCGSTNLANSHVILACDGASHTFGPFPSGPSSRTYACTPTTIAGLSYLQVSGLAFSTTIVDTTPPTLTLPSDITDILAGRAGAPVTFSATASDILDPSPAVSCSAKSGATFPVGTTTVTCTAIDAAGNKATGSFHVSVVYKFGGFLPPLQGGATYHIGSVIPVRFTLTNAAGREVYFATGKVTAGSVAGAFKLEGDHYEFNLDTKGMAAGPLAIYLSTNDGTTHSITIDLTSSFITSLSLECSPPTVFTGETTRCDAMVTSQDGPTPTGAIAFASSGSRGSFGRVSCHAGDQGYSGPSGDGGRALSCSVDYSSSSPGVQTITAAYPGDSQDLPSSATFTLTVTSIPTTTSLTCNPSSVQPGKATHCIADVESRDGSSPTGGVTFSSSDAHGAFGKVACSSQNYPRSEGRELTCTVDYTASAGGSQTITALYPGDATHSSSKGTFLLNRDRGDAAGPADAFATLAWITIGTTALYPFLKVWRPDLAVRGPAREEA